MKITKEFLEDRFEYKDGHLFYRQSTGNARQGRQAGTISTSGYIHIMINGRLYHEHTLIFFLHYGYFAKEIDHIDHNKINNHIENIREVNRSQNRANSKKRKGCSSKFKGVFRHCDSCKKPWRSQIEINGHQNRLGDFAIEEDAARAYDRAAIEAWGENACTNEMLGLYKEK
jgi:hypothetical protein